MSEKDDIINKLTLQVEEAKKENEELRKQIPEPTDPNDYLKFEQEIYDKVLALPDFSSMNRILYGLNSQIQQKYYKMMLDQQNATAGATSTSNGYYGAGEQQMSNGGMFMQSQQMMGPMQYMGGSGYTNSSSTQVKDPNSNK